MQVTDSTPRLLLSIVALSVAVPVILLFPDPSLRFALTLGKFLPSAASCALFTYLSEQHRRALLVTAIGAFVGWLLAPTVYVSYEFANWYDDYAYLYKYAPVYSGIGSLVAGLTLYAFERIAKAVGTK